MQAIRNSPLWLIFWMISGAAGVYIQYRTTRRYVFEKPGNLERSF